MPVATAQIFLNDYMELVTGMFDQPFGDFYETQGPFWVNRMITAPLPYGSEALITPTDLGAQLRGGLQWGKLGPGRRLHRVGVEWAAFHAFPAGGGRQCGRRRQQHQHQYSLQGIRRPYPRLSAAGRFEARSARSRRVDLRREVPGWDVAELVGR